jgi:glucosamine-6-phosphate deaminase
MPEPQLQGRMKVRRVTGRAEGERAVALEVAALVREREAAGRCAVLGLATGRTPLGVYRELVRMTREEGLELSRVTTFNLDEYEGLSPGDPRSFRSVMERALFQPAGFDPALIHFPEAGLAGAEQERACAAFEAAIREAGGIDLQLLGIGRNGHLAFNEPGSARDSRTRRVRLAESTRRDALADFASLEQVPTHAVSMGLATILEARALRVLAFGAAKREILGRILAEAPTPADLLLPASRLREHPDVLLWMDAEAAPER